MTRFGEQVAVIWIKSCAIMGLEVETIHDWRDVTFGGQSPEPGEEHLDELREAVKSKEFDFRPFDRRRRRQIRSH